jgi:photosystem II stability/assembly factor-like uncharacterized protein
MRANSIGRNLIKVWMLVLSLGAGVSSSYAQRPPGMRADEDSFRFRFVGPRAGNRVASIAGVPGDPSTYYAGAASGGVWKTTDGGNRWEPIFDKEPVAAIGAIAVAPSDPSVIWVGTGEAWAIRDSDVMGNGVYVSTDYGKNWTHVGLDDTGRIGRIVVHPTNPDVAFVCALGRTTGPQQERGVYRTTDRGQHWERVLFADENTGCSGLAMDAHNPRILLAGLWQVEMHTWGELSGGPGSAVYISRDGGTKWTKLDGHGLPRAPLGKIDVAIAPTNPERYFALIQTKEQGALWRSDNAGENWQTVNYQRQLIGRAGYYIRIAVSTGNDNEVYVANSSFLESLDGGEIFKEVPWGGDNHDIWVDPKDPDRFVITDDGGLNITTVHGRGFHRVQLPIGQMYHVAVDNQVPYYVYTNMQDGPNMRGPSIAPPLEYGRAVDTGWERRMGGCESGFTLPDPTDPNIVWASCYGNEVTRWDAKTKRARSVSPWIHSLDSPPSDLKYRCHWTPPLAIDPFDHNTVYYGCQVIFKTTNGGQSWSVISPDLSTQDPKYLGSSGGLVGDNLGQFYGEVVFAIAPSEAQQGLIWAGTNDGLIWYTKDGGANWINVTKNINDLAPWGTVTRIEPSHFDAGTAYVCVDYHLMDNRDPYIFRTTDFGKTWTKLSDGLPKHPLGYVRTITEDPNQKGLLFAGTGNGLFYSIDDGAHWTAFTAGLPHAPITWDAVQKQFHDLVVSTYGRGIYILDDITPLEQMAQKAADEPVRLFAPRETLRIFPNGGAAITYSLKAASKAPPKIELLDSSGVVIRKLEGLPGRAGMNRLEWNFLYDPPKLVALRTTPTENPHIWEERRFRGNDSRQVLHWGIREAEVGPMALPGKYTVRLTVDGHTVTQPLTVVKNPNVHASEAELAAAFNMQLRIRDDITKTSESVNKVEWMRKQLDVIARMLGRKNEPQTAATGEKKEEGKDKKPEKSDANPDPELLKAVEAMDQKMQEVEYKFISRADALSDDKYYSIPEKIYLHLIWLNGEVGTGAGDVAGGVDNPPTDTAAAILQIFESDLAGAQSGYQNLIEKELPAFNRALLDKGIAPIAFVRPAETEDEDDTGS